MTIVDIIIITVATIFNSALWYYIGAQYGKNKEVKNLRELREIDSKIIYHAQRELLLLKLTIHSCENLEVFRESSYIKDSIPEAMKVFQENLNEANITDIR